MSGGPPAVVARVAGRPITAPALLSQIARAGEHADRERVLQRMIRHEALVARAREAGYDRDPQVLQSIDELLARRYLDDRLGVAGAALTEGEVRAFYEANAGRFAVPERRKGAVIFVRVPRTAPAAKRAELQARAEAVRSEAAAAADDRAAFARLVAQYSDDAPTRYQGGDTGWVERESDSRGPWEPGVVAALFDLPQAGQLAPGVVRAPGGFYVVKLDAVAPARIRPFADVRAQAEYLAGRDRQERAEARIDAEVLHGLKIEINRTLLDTLPAPVRPATPAAPPDMPSS